VGQSLGSAADASCDYSIVIPVYKSESTLEDLVSGLATLQQDLPGSLEVVFVSDGSPDDSVAVLRRLLPEAPLASRFLVLSMY
jgi:glycosyltransferase involved in cell wall biosynthesis